MKSPAKVNIFLKIVGFRENYHLINSRFMRIHTLCDEITIEKNSTNRFEIEGNFGCTTEQNTIYKALKHLLAFTNNRAIEHFFLGHKVVVEKKIPEFAGLGGGSSNAATFLLLANKHLELGLTNHELTQIGSAVGADVPFFLSQFTSANVSGIGEEIVEFVEPSLEFEIFTPPILCDTKKVFEQYRIIMSDFDKLNAKKFLNLSSLDIIKSFNADILNDLMAPALSIYPPLQDYVQDGWFFSGSGSSFFRIKG